VDFFDDLGQATQYANTAIGLMMQHNVPATPQNFTVWYTYASDRDLALKKALDVLISNSQEFNEAQNAEIFDKYFGNLNEGVAIQHTGSQMALTVGKVMSLIEKATDDAELFGNTLEASVGSLSADSSGADIGEVVKALAAETKKMVSQNQALHYQLESSTAEIKTLKENLEDVQKEALTDGLTGIANRKNFDISLRREAMDAMENGAPLCLIMADIDHFKNFNDTHGHQTGDHVLRFVGSMLTNSVKGQDIPARYGGEEFGIILPNTELAEAMHIADTIRQAISAKRLRKKQSGEDIGCITISMGIAQFRPGEPLNALIKRADDGLYHAKHLGRNRVVAETELNAAAD
jgi:diguanylate cyclase